MLYTTRTTTDRPHASTRAGRYFSSPRTSFVMDTLCVFVFSVICSVRYENLRPNSPRENSFLLCGGVPLQIPNLPNVLAPERVSAHWNTINTLMKFSG